MVCDGETSRLEVAQELLKIIKKDNMVKLTEVDSQFFMKEYFAPRPPSERLINKKLNLRNLNLMRNWKKALKDYIDNYYEGYL